MGTVLTGVEFALTDQNTIFSGVPQGYVDIGQNDVPRAEQPDLDRGRASRSLIWVLLDRTELGRYMYAIGGNPEAARLSGVRVAPPAPPGLRHRRASPPRSSASCSPRRAASYAPNAGASYLLPAFAAVFLGVGGLPPGRVQRARDGHRRAVPRRDPDRPDDARPRDLRHQPRPGRHPDHRRAGQPARAARAHDATADAPRRDQSIEIRGLVKRYPGVRRARRRRRRDPGAASVLGLLGKNGAGKSTLIKVLAGRDPARRAARSSSTASRSRIHDPHARHASSGSPSSTRSWPTSPTCRWPRTSSSASATPSAPGVCVDRRAPARARRATVLERLERRHRPRRAAGRSLSIAQRRLVMIARGIAAERPPARARRADRFADGEEIEHLARACVRSLRDDGVAIVYVSHRLDEIFADHRPRRRHARRHSVVSAPHRRTLTKPS